MNHTYYFMAGLPRSGSTVLKAILNQNPNIHTEPASPVMEMMYWNEKYLIDSEQYLSYPKPKSAYNVISNIIKNYYFDTEKEIVIDHCRSWSNNIERIKTYITPIPKIICPVRDVLEILTSFITMIRRNKDQISFIDQELINRGLKLTDDNRCDYLMSKDGIVDQALWAQLQAFNRRDNEKYLLLIDYNNLVANPTEVISKIYNFLELDLYKHNFNHITNLHRENESQWNLNDMHDIRNKLQKTSNNPEKILSDYVLTKYNKMEYWKYSSHNYKA
jgi:sulfotransferase